MLFGRCGCDLPNLHVASLIAQVVPSRQQPTGTESDVIGHTQFDSFHRTAWQDNDVEREAAVHRTAEDYANAEFWRWVLAAAIGATMGALAFGVDWGIDALNKAKFNLVKQKISSSGEAAGTASAPQLVRRH